MRNAAGGSLRSRGELAALAVDLDRTLISPEGKGLKSASQVLKDCQRMGLKVILASGREYNVLSAFADELRYVDAVVAENGAVIEAPAGSRVTVIGRATAARVRRRLAGAPWANVECGEVVVSVPRSDGSKIATLLEGLGVYLVPNVDRVMILPKGISKASGVRSAIGRLHLESSAFAAVGDGENDIPLLRAATLSGAVRNARPQVLACADYVCRASFSAGVAEFVRGPVTDALRGRSSVGRRHVLREVD
jgi:hydroxymethylpyrimidine pyrophosphatase-like HAD family hydrolase